MYTEDNQQNPVDFLDQIAPKSAQNNWLMSKKPLLIGLVAMVIILIFVLIFGLTKGNTQTTTRLAARLKDTSTIVNSATTKIKSSQLRALNSNLKSRLLNETTDIVPFLAKEGVKIDKIDKNITTSETSTKIMSVLEDARLNATYDRIYAREMAYKLSTVIVLMNKIKKASNSVSLKEYLTTSVNNLAPIQKDLADFNTIDN